MAKVIVQAWTTVDGVAQAPGDPDEDTSGGFRHGGWSLPYFDQTAQEWVVGTAVDLTDGGALVVQTDGGARVPVLAGDVQHLLPLEPPGAG